MLVRNCEKLLFKDVDKNQVRRSSKNLKDLFSLQKKLKELTPRYNVRKKQQNLLIKSTKEPYLQDKIMSSENNTKTAWHVISELNNHNKNAPQNITLAESD